MAVALERAAGNRSLSQFCAEFARPLLLVDTFENWQELEGWLYQDFLLTLPANLGVVFAGRQAPSAAWQQDAGWRDLMTITRLGALSGQECSDYLTLRSIPQARFDHLLGFSGGHPLALAMAADAVLEGGQPDLSGEAGHTLYQTLLESFTREARQTDQQQALDACAVVWELTEDLLARLLARDDARELFAWLAGLSFIERGRQGLVPHDIVRDVLMQTMDARAPGRYPALARSAVGWVVDRMEGEAALTRADAARVGAQAMFALRQVAVVQHYLSAEGADNLYLDRARNGADWAALAEMTLRHEGPESCAWFEFWRERFPDNVTVIRGIQGDPRAYILRLDMEALAPEDRAADPFTERLWRAIESDIQPLPGERLAFHRFWINHDYAAHGSPEKTQMMMAITSYNLTTPNLRLTAQVFGTRTPSWPQQAAAIGLHMLEDSAITIGKHAYQIFYNDWLREPPMRHYRLFADRGDRASSRTRLLATQFKTAAAALRQSGAGGERLHRVLQHSYFAPAPSQKKAADACHMGYSTYRRYLADARHALVAELWRREQAHR